jgi:hypothetical protein
MGERMHAIDRWLVEATRPDATTLINVEGSDCKWYLTSWASHCCPMKLRTKGAQARGCIPLLPHRALMTRVWSTWQESDLHDKSLIYIWKDTWNRWMLPCQGSTLSSEEEIQYWWESDPIMTRAWSTFERIHEIDGCLVKAALSQAGRRSNTYESLIQ